MDVQYGKEVYSRLWHVLRSRYVTPLGSPRLLTYSTAGTHSLDQALVLFGRPKSVTGFFRVQRDAESEVEDSFTIILQYDGAQKDLLVTVKTAVVTPMDQQLKQLVRGTKGSFIKVLSLLSPKPDADQCPSSNSAAPA